MTQSPSIRVLVVDDHPIVRTGLMTMLEYEPDMTVVGEAGDGQQAVEQFRHLQPDVVLMDLRLPQMSGVAAITAICQEFPHASIIALMTDDGDEDIYRGLQAGAKGYLLKDAARQELVEAIRMVHGGQKYLPVAVSAKLVEWMTSPQLSERETQVLRLLATGKSNRDIATVLGITEGTVKFHINKIFQKLGVRDRTQAVIEAFKRGIARL